MLEFPVGIQLKSGQPKKVLVWHANIQCYKTGCEAIFASNPLKRELL